MAFYKMQHNSNYDGYFPVAVTVGKPVETEEVADELAALSTVSRSDVNAVLGNLAQVLSKFMKTGKSVHVKGLGYFRYKLDTISVQSLEDFDFSKHVKAVRVRFEPEKEKTSDGKYKRELVGSDIEWIEMPSSS